MVNSAKVCYSSCPSQHSMAVTRSSLSAQQHGESSITGRYYPWNASLWELHEPVKLPRCLCVPKQPKQQEPLRMLAPTKIYQAATVDGDEGN